MSQVPTLTQELEQFLYTHAQNMPYKRQLLSIVVKWEQAYLERINELEKLDNAGNRMESEGGSIRTSQYEDDDPFDHLPDLEGTRYEGID